MQGCPVPTCIYPGCPYIGHRQTAATRARYCYSLPCLELGAWLDAMEFFLCCTTPLASPCKLLHAARELEGERNRRQGVGVCKQPLTHGPMLCPAETSQESVLAGTVYVKKWLCYVALNWCICPRLQGKLVPRPRRPFLEAAALSLFTLPSAFTLLAKL